MTSLDGFDHPLTGRYASEEMQRLFSTGHRYSTWRRMWLTLAEAERELGLEIPAEAIEQMRANLEVTEEDLERVREYEKRTRHDVIRECLRFELVTARVVERLLRVVDGFLNRCRVVNCLQVYRGHRDTRAITVQRHL